MQKWTKIEQNKTDTAVVQFPVKTSHERRLSKNKTQVEWLKLSSECSHCGDSCASSSPYVVRIHIQASQRVKRKERKRKKMTNSQGNLGSQR